MHFIKCIIIVLQFTTLFNKKTAQIPKLKKPTIIDFLRFRCISWIICALYCNSYKTIHVVRKLCLCSLQDPQCMPRSSPIQQWSISKVVLEKNITDSFIQDNIFNAPWRYLRTKLECVKIFKGYTHLKRTCFTFLFLRSYFYDS